MKSLVIKTDPVKGRGVYANEPIKDGETIEICQLLVVPKDEVGDFLHRYVFDYSKTKLAIALGNGSLYNHSKHPNISCYFDFNKSVLIFEAIRNIATGEELLFNYGYTKAELKQYNIQ